LPPAAPETGLSSVDSTVNALTSFMVSAGCLAALLQHGEENHDMAHRSA
jgi:hypothetical protein